MRSIVGISQDECRARTREDAVEDEECFVQVAFNNDGVFRTEYIDQKITKLKCGCIMINTYEEILGDEEDAD